MPVLKNAARDLLTRAVTQLEGAGVGGARGSKRKAASRGTSAAIRGRSAVPQKRQPQRVYRKKDDKRKTLVKKKGGSKKKKGQTPKRTKQGGEGKKSKLFRFY
jgi:hypothetical protein